MCLLGEDQCPGWATHRLPRQWTLSCAGACILCIKVYGRLGWETSKHVSTLPADESAFSASGPLFWVCLHASYFSLAGLHLQLPDACWCSVDGFRVFQACWRQHKNRGSLTLEINTCISLVDKVNCLLPAKTDGWCSLAAAQESFPEQQSINV